MVNDELCFENVPELKCDHEEADTRLIFHTKHVSDNMYANVVIKTPDTDVRIILISLAGDISSNLYM